MSAFHTLLAAAFFFVAYFILRWSTRDKVEWLRDNLSTTPCRPKTSASDGPYRAGEFSCITEGGIPDPREEQESVKLISRTIEATWLGGLRLLFLSFAIGYSISAVVLHFLGGAL